MRILLVSYNPEELSRDEAYLNNHGHEVVVAKNYVSGLSAFLKDPTNPDKSIDVVIDDIDIKCWSGSSWPGLWLLGQVRRKQILVPFLLHAVTTSYKEHGIQLIDFTTLNKESPVVVFHQREQDRGYIGDFLTRIR